MTKVAAAARIVAVHDGVADVQFEAASACASCGAKSVCGSGNTRRVQLPVPAGVAAGDHVTLNLPEAQLQLGAILAYLLPAVTTLLGGALLSGGGDGYAALGATLGLGAGLLCLRLLAPATLGSGIHVCPSDSPQGETP